MHYHFGYLLSIISALLLAVVAWESVADKPAMQGALVIGVALSIIGMILRWRGHSLEKHDE